MKRTKLEEYIAIINILLVNGALELKGVVGLSGIDSVKVSDSLTFLLEIHAIEKTLNLKGMQLYNATSKGLKVVKYFHGGIKPEW